MSASETLLRLIESTSPDDTAKLDEIDARGQHYFLNPPDAKLVWVDGAAGYSWQWKTRHGLAYKPETPKIHSLP